MVTPLGVRRRESLKLLPTAPGPISPQPTPLFARSLIPTPCTGGGVGSWARLPRGHTQGPGVGTGPPGRGGADGQTAVRPPRRAGRPEAGGRPGGPGLGSFLSTIGGETPSGRCFPPGGRVLRPALAAVAAAAAGASNLCHLFTTSGPGVPGQHYAHLTVPDRHVCLYEPAQPSGHHLPGHGQRRGRDLHEGTD